MVAQPESMEGDHTLDQCTGRWHYSMKPSRFVRVHGGISSRTGYTIWWRYGYCGRYGQYGGTCHHLTRPQPGREASARRFPNADTIPRIRQVRAKIYVAGGRVDRELETLLDRYVAAQLAGDSREALRVVLDDGVEAGIAIPTLYLDVLTAAQHRIGALWQTNHISVAHEHVATGISQLVLAHLYPLLPRAPLVGRRVLVSCIDSELHELGGRMVADFFEMAGFTTRFLGSSLPTNDLIAMVREDQPDLLVLSVTMSPHLRGLSKAALRLRDAVGDRLALAVGGQAFEWDPSAIPAVGAEVYGRDATESVSEARQLLLTDMP